MFKNKSMIILLILGIIYFLLNDFNKENYNLIFNLNAWNLLENLKITQLIDHLIMIDKANQGMTHIPGNF